MQTAAPTQPTIIAPPHAGIIPPAPSSIAPPSAATSYLPPFHFSHPDFLAKNPFLPYDLANLRGVANGRTIHHIQQLSTTQTMPPMNVDHMNMSRLSPASSRPSSSSPPSSAHSISVKMNTSIDVQSTHDTDDSDDEQIDVVKSAFVPILRPNPNNTQQSIVGIADSTVHEPIQAAERPKCDLKAPSSRKPGHEIARVCPQSPETKIKSPIMAQKPVWRPYWKLYSKSAIASVCQIDLCLKISFRELCLMCENSAQSDAFNDVFLKLISGVSERRCAQPTGK